MKLYLDRKILLNIEGVKTPICDSLDLDSPSGDCLNGVKG